MNVGSPEFLFRLQEQLKPEHWNLNYLHQLMTENPASPDVYYPTIILRVSFHVMQDFYNQRSFVRNFEKLYDAEVVSLGHQVCKPYIL